MRTPITGALLSFTSQNWSYPEMIKMIMILISGLLIFCDSSLSKSRNLDELVTDVPQEWQIAVIKETLDGRDSIDILDIRGKLIKTITVPGRTWSLSWSSDGYDLAFMVDQNLSPQARRESLTNDPFYQPPGQLFVLDLSDEKLTQITDTAYKTWLPKIAPDGKQISFMSDQHGQGDLYLSPTCNPFLTRLTNGKNWPLEGPLWFSPSEIIYNSFVGDKLEVFRMNVIDRTRKHLPLGAPPHSKTGYLALSHDRQRLAFVTRDRELDEKKGIINPQIYVADLDGRHRQRLTFDETISYAPQWSPDDRWIAFLREIETKDGPRANLYVIGDDGTREKLIATTVTSYPRWLSYENVIVYTAYSEQKNALYLFDLNSGKVNRIGDRQAIYREPTTREIFPL